MTRFDPLPSRYSPVVDLARTFFLKNMGCTALEAHRVSWKIYTCIFAQPACRRVNAHAGFAFFPKSLYRQAPDVSTEFCRLHY
ncbi:hypothetical protein, partial [Rhodoferax sp.]|uniref:hypothetical protein n=1 Tax=Rhodoferax sp. TaxID=50421 RepID=UPI002ACD77A7